MVLIAFMMTGVVVFAQERRMGYRDEDMTARREDRRTHTHRVAGDRDAAIKRELSMSDRQFDRYHQANKSYHERLSHMRHASTNEHGRKAEFMKLRKDHERDMRSILNKRQYQQWSERERSLHHHRRDHDGERRRTHSESHSR